MRPPASTFDRVTAKRAVGFYAVLTLILRSDQPMRPCDLDNLALVIAVVLARAERRAGGRP